ncbi:hypothetical protein AB4212_43310, partial [Streptomyces sp. 2MCAF27]
MDSRDREIDRRRLLGGALGAATAMTGASLLGATSAMAQPAAGHSTAGHSTAAAPPTSTLWREFRAAPYTHPQIPYV